VAKPIPTDPYLEIFKDDSIIVDMPTDAKRLHRKLTFGVLMQLLMPPCIPCCILNGLPCTVLFCPGDKFERTADARHIYLREKSLLYHLKGGEPEYPHICWCMPRLQTKHDIQLVFSLDDNIGLEPKHFTECCASIDSVALTYNYQTIALLDTPENLEEFIAKFQEQQAKARENPPSKDINPIIREMHCVISEYMALLTNSKIPSRVERRGSDTHIAVDHAQLEFHARTYYKELEDKLANLQSLLNGGGGAPPVAEIVRDEPLPLNRFVQMSLVDVSGILKQLGLQDHCPSFEKAGVDGSVLVMLDESALVELGITSSLERKKLLGWILKQKQ
jgi:hypothetical protein